MSILPASGPRSATSDDVGIIVGRFQIHELHEGHRHIIDVVKSLHDKVIIFVGLSPLRNTARNPLDFSSRKRMIQEVYPEIDVFYIEDNRSDSVWSANLDREITRWLIPGQKAILYGSRDSFLPYYHGKFPTSELDSTTHISASEIRRRISNQYRATSDFRAGVIAASLNRYPTCYPTVDVAIIRRMNNMVLVAQKSGEAEYRFIGGFGDPSSSSYEDDVRRESLEEANVEINNIMYVGSHLVDDWRYRSESDKIKTLFFIAEYESGQVTAGDDVSVVRWINLLDLISGKVPIVDEHKPLVQLLSAYLSQHGWFMSTT